jgi:hypothetical protein
VARENPESQVWQEYSEVHEEQEDGQVLHMLFELNVPSGQDVRHSDP